LGDPSFADWTCAADLACRSGTHDEVGVCATVARTAGDACEDARGARMVADPSELCAGQATGAAQCIPNAYGFPLGFCTGSCAELGRRAGSSVCAPLLASGYEPICFPRDEPVEDCVRNRGLVTATTTRACSADEPCRDDYSCLRIPGSAPGTGGCVPPYFLFDFRVDGPKLDR
jgi:hypothetical protein